VNFCTRGLKLKIIKIIIDQNFFKIYNLDD